MTFTLLAILIAKNGKYSSDHASKTTTGQRSPQPHLRISGVDDLQLVIRLAAAAEAPETLLEEMWENPTEIVG